MNKNSGWFKFFFKNLFFLVVGLAMGAAMTSALLFFFPPDFSEREIRGECNKWQNWAQEIRADIFSPSAEMVRQCRKVGIELTVKKGEEE